MRRLVVSGMATSAVVATALIASPVQASVSAPPAPKGLTVVRDSGNENQLNISWKPVPGISNYMVRVNDGAKDTNLIVDADKTSAVFRGAGVCTSYRVAVSAVVSQDAMGTTGTTFIQALAPGSISGPSATRSNSGEKASVEWNAPISGYKVKVTQVSNGNVLVNRTQDGRTVNLDDLNPERMYSVKVAAENSYGSCITSNIVLGNNRPSSPEFTVVRPPGQPAAATVSWKPVAWAGYGPITGYEIGYKRINQKGYTWVSAGHSARNKTIQELDPTVNWTFVMRAVNGNINGLLSKTYTLYRSGYEPSPANVTITGGDDSITVDFSSPVGKASNFPTARIEIAKANGTKGWTDKTMVTNEAGRSTFSPVPCGSYTVVVTGLGSNSAQQLVRMAARVCDPAPECFVSTLQNGSFETPTIPNASYRILPSSTEGLQWKNTAENFIELWSNGYSNSSGGKVTAAEGRQLAELNANKAGTLYQDLPTTPGTKMRWHLKHRGRAGEDTMRVLIGVPGKTLEQSGSQLKTGNSAWVLYTDTYKIPAGQTTTRFAFQAVKTASSISVGNFLDDIVFTPETCQ
jgi:hypothetical protein